MIIFRAIVPHPPLLIPEVGKGQEKKLKKTREAMEKLSQELAELEPDVIIFITPHSLIYPDRFNICAMENLKVSLEHFKDEKDNWRGQSDLRLAYEIADAAEKNDLQTILYENEDKEFQLDEGIAVPLYFINEAVENSFKLISIGYSHLSRIEHYQFGQVLAEVCEKSKKRIAIIATGDLSHRLGYPAPEGFEYEGEAFDKELIELLELSDENAILQMEEEMVENAGECGYNSILILLGTLFRQDFKTEVYSYEGPFGVGHLVARIS